LFIFLNIWFTLVFVFSTIIIMCYHISLTKKDETIRKRFEIPQSDLNVYIPFYHRNGFEQEPIYIIKDVEPFKLTPAYWGMLPESYHLSQRRAFLKKSNTLNARAEGLLESPMFQKPIKHNRCLILADGFFEPHGFNGRNYPHYITYRDNGIMGIAGIYTELEEHVFTVSLITTLANDYFKKIHNKKNNLGEYRMPLILDERDEFDWLDTHSQIQQVNDLLSSFTNKEFQSYTVSKDVMNSHVKSDYSDILNKVDYPELQTLF